MMQIRRTILLVEAQVKLNLFNKNFIIIACNLPISSYKHIYIFRCAFLMNKFLYWHTYSTETWNRDHKIPTHWFYNEHLRVGQNFKKRKTAAALNKYANVIPLLNHVTSPYVGGRFLLYTEISLIIHAAPKICMKLRLLLPLLFRPGFVYILYRPG